MTPRAPRRLEFLSAIRHHLSRRLLSLGARSREGNRDASPNGFVGVPGREPVDSRPVQGSLATKRDFLLMLGVFVAVRHMRPHFRVLG